MRKQPADRVHIDFKDSGLPHLFELTQVELYRARGPLERHEHPNQFEIVVHYEGQQYYELDGVSYLTRAGDIFISLPNEVHSTGNWNEEKSRFYYFVFECMPDTKQFMGLPLEASDYLIRKLYSVQSRIVHGGAVVLPVLKETIDVFRSHHPLRQMKLQSLMYDFFYKLCLLLDYEEITTQNIPADIKKAMDYISGNPSEIPTIEFLADLVGISPSQFNKKFKKYCGSSVHTFIMRGKIAIAREMLQSTACSITSIAFELGFSSSQGFARSFKEYTGVTPSACREESGAVKNCPDLHASSLKDKGRQKR